MSHKKMYESSESPQPSKAQRWWGQRESYPVNTVSYTQVEISVEWRVVKMMQYALKHVPYNFGARDYALDELRRAVEQSGLYDCRRVTIQVRNQQNIYTIEEIQSAQEDMVSKDIYQGWERLRHSADERLMYEI
ncbi:uncharacterized protein ATNIH1004_002175 [Aspergillus tanneri]|uniref:Uncharacterized protein n=1 Tax=Aspergillus tanneri TaxID=1220188 RepID=A0A5M9MVU3_9EURO|nr:uncharacterized protein ATNIH1004_002175 [Aspergillus tanneri]KAA8649504.1 hypothetical protein ATNIH1004_002175 [Aspergillus tanneri]